MGLNSAITQWRQVLGSDNVLPGDLAQRKYGSDTGGAHRRIAAALTILDVETVQSVVRIAHEHSVAIYPISTGHNWGYGSALPAREGNVIVDLCALRNILAFDPELGVVTVQPGVTQQLLADFLDAGDHPYLVPITGAGPDCSLMGNALERGYGITPHADHFGAVTDVEAVLPDGSLYRTAMHEVGGVELARLFKWGIGPYSVGLFSQGGFGVVTSMTIVLAQRPHSVQACLFTLQDDALLEPAVVAIRSLITGLGGTLGGINLMNRNRVLGMVAPFPSGQLGADGLMGTELLAKLGRTHNIAPWTGFVSLYGTERVVAAAKLDIGSTLSGIAKRVTFVSPKRIRALRTFARWMPGATGRSFLRRIGLLEETLEMVAGRPKSVTLNLAYWRIQNALKGPRLDPARDGCGLLWYAPLVPMRAERVRAYINMVKEVTQRSRIEPMVTLTSLNDRLFDSTVPILFDRIDPNAILCARACHSELLAEGRKQGWFPYRLGIEDMDWLASLHPYSSHFTQVLRNSLDPHSIMSPGRYN